MRSLGLHLSGSNSQKTSVAVLVGNPRYEPLRLQALYEKIGSQGKIFSDERLVMILKHELPLERVFVDCPLTLPPCVRCQRPSCPGVVRCEDVSVAYMQSLAENLKKAGRRKKRPLNPQSQRLYDVWSQTFRETAFHHPTYNANYAPLVTRALTLQRRLNNIEPRIVLRETSVEHSLAGLAPSLGFDTSVAHAYKSFEDGLSIRRDILTALRKKGWLAEQLSEQVDEGKITEGVENFQAYITALVAALHLAGFCLAKPAELQLDEGWSHTPSLMETIDRTSYIESQHLTNSSDTRLLL